MPPTVLAEIRAELEVSIAASATACLAAIIPKRAVRVQAFSESTSAISIN